jgi:hypothetical protein
MAIHIATSHDRNTEFLFSIIEVGCLEPERFVEVRMFDCKLLVCSGSGSFSALWLFLFPFDVAAMDLSVHPVLFCVWPSAELLVRGTYFFSFIKSS